MTSTLGHDRENHVLTCRPGGGGSTEVRAGPDHLEIGNGSEPPHMLSIEWSQFAFTPYDGYYYVIRIKNVEFCL